MRSSMINASECTGSTFVDKDHNLILTAGLIIINYNKLRELISKCLL